MKPIEVPVSLDWGGDGLDALEFVSCANVNNSQIYCEWEILSKLLRRC